MALEALGWSQPEALTQQRQVEAILFNPDQDFCRRGGERRGSNTSYRRHRLLTARLAPHRCMAALIPATCEALQPNSPAS